MLLKVARGVITLYRFLAGHETKVVVAGRCKTWTLDSGLDSGLHFGLDIGLNHSWPRRHTEDQAGDVHNKYNTHT